MLPVCHLTQKVFCVSQRKQAILTKGDLQGFAQCFFMWLLSLFYYCHYFINEQMHDPD